MNYEEYIGIETPILYKYQNKMIPEIVDVIKDYLFLHPNKLPLYLDKSITVEDLLKHISSSQKRLISEPIDLLESIRIFVEKKLC